MIPQLHSGNSLTRVSFDRTPGEYGAATVQLAFGEKGEHSLAYTAQELARLPLTLMLRVIEDAESLWAEKHLARGVALAAGAEVADLVEWTPSHIEWRLIVKCHDCDGYGCSGCSGLGSRPGGLFYTDTEGREIDAPGWD